MKQQNHKRNAAFNGSVVKWGAFSILALLAVAVCGGLIHLPNFGEFAGISLGAAPLFLLGSVVLEPEVFQKTVLDGVEAHGTQIKSLSDKLSAVEKSHGEFSTEFKAAHEELSKKLLEVQKAQIGNRSRAARIPGQVSEDCARFFGAITLVAGIRQERFSGRTLEMAQSEIKNILGVEAKASLTTSDIPIPTMWNGEVVELVSNYGFARRFGTVFPLGAGVVKLPKLGTDTAFGLISASAAVTAKSPTVTFVTFTPEKSGGLVTLPSELDEDSIVGIGQFLARYGARQMAKAEDTLFFVGDGSTQGAVAGLTYSTITNSKVTQMASTKTHYSDATLANLRSIRALVDAPVLQNAAYYLHPTFEQLLASLNTSGDRPYNPQAQIAGVGASGFGSTGPTLDGFPIRWVDVMPAYSTSANASKTFVLFGDATYQYLGVRGGMRVDTSREAAFSTDEIMVRFLERFTIGLMATGAVAGLETAAS